MSKPAWKTVAALAATLVLWASAFAAIRKALQHYAPTHLAFSRFLVASVVLAVVATFSKVRLPVLSDVPRVLLVGLCGIAGYNIALNYGEVTVTAGAASFIVNTVPIWTSLLSVILLRESVSPVAWLGIGLSFSGVALIAASESGGFRFGAGAMALVCAAIFQALYFVLQKPLLTKYGAFPVVCYAVWAGTFAMLPFALNLKSGLVTADDSSSVAVLYLGVFPSTVAYLCWSYVLERMPASRAAPFLYVVPVLTLAIAFVWLGERPAVLSLAGGLLALGGVVLVNTLGKLTPLNGRT